MRYEKGSFVLIPNKKQLAETEPYVQSVYFWVCNYADDGGVCFPSRATIARNAGCSVKSVDRALEFLCEKGLLSKETRKDGMKNLTNVYQIEIAGSVSQSLPSVSESLGVASEGRTELYPVLTKTTEEVEDDEREYFRGTPKVIPAPYSWRATSEYWSTGPRNLQILNWYFREADLWERATTEFRLKAMMARHSKAAHRIAKAGWKPDELDEALGRIQKNKSLNGEWTLETMEKYLTK